MPAAPAVHVAIAAQSCMLSGMGRALASAMREHSRNRGAGLRAVCCMRMHAMLMAAAVARRPCFTGPGHVRTSRAAHVSGAGHLLWLG